MEKTQNEARARILTGIVIGAALCAFLLLSHIPVILYAVSALLCVGGIWELHRAVRGTCSNWITYLCLLFGAAVFCAPFEKYQEVITCLFPLSFLLFGWLMYHVGRMDQIHTETLLCISAVIILFFRSIPEIREMKNGFFLLVMTVLTGCITDIGAYAIGKRFGKRKLAAKVSPKKTLAGALGGTLTAFIILMLASKICEKLGVFVVNDLRLAGYLVLSSIVGQFGDLSMSSVKRISGVKDYRNLLPGHGGLLDRFDSLLFIAPFTYLFCQYCGTLLS